MCGIAGILDEHASGPPQAGELRTMIETLHHRGPDGYGFFTDAACGLAHARLSIIDLSTGEQPIHNEDRTVWVVLNGEIFNYIELRAQLQAAGHAFYTQSDTEVIVHLYEQHGDDFVHHLNGQFAIALWDQKRSRLVLARDRTGIRPLFHTRHDGRLLFASEIKALFALDGVPRRLDPVALGDTMTYWSTLEPDTVFQGVRCLPAGCLLAIEAGREHLTQYWDWSFARDSSASTRSIEDWASELRALLIDSVRLQLRADVPVGAYLSGGLDSSAIAALVRLYTGAKLRTFSVAFDDPEFDESGYQEQMAKHLGTEHTRVLCRPGDIARIFARMVWHTEAPVLRTAPAPLMLLSERVRAEGYKVVLTGEGADEVFAGYDLFKEAKIRRFWGRFPQSGIRPLLLRRLYPYLKHSPVAGGAFAERFFGSDLARLDHPCFAHATRWTATRRIWQFFSPEWRAQLGQRDPFASALARLGRDFSDWPPLGRDQYFEAHTLLSGYLLSSQGDRVAMANSIEGRFPFLDHRVIELASRMPPSLKIRGLNEKYVLKRAVGDLLPAQVVARTKQPYRAPDSQSFFVGGRPTDEVADLLSARRLRAAGYFDPVAVGKLVEKCRAGRAIGFADNMAFVGILSTMMLDEQLIRGRAPVATPAPMSAAAS